MSGSPLAGPALPHPDPAGGTARSVRRFGRHGACRAARQFDLRQWALCSRRARRCRAASRRADGRLQGQPARGRRRCGRGRGRPVRRYRGTRPTSRSAPGQRRARRVLRPRDVCEQRGRSGRLARPGAAALCRWICPHARIRSRPGLPTAVCTIYDTPPTAPDQPIIRTALAVFNDVITRAAFAHRLPLIDLRLLCDDDEHYANPIEPSATGGARIAEAVADWLTVARDWTPAIARPLAQSRALAASALCDIITFYRSTGGSDGNG